MNPLDLNVGDLLPPKQVVVTPERIQWYGDGMHSAATGKLTRAGENIHTDIAYAQGQGLTTAIADGMMSTAWISSVLLKAFGRHYLERRTEDQIHQDDRPRSGDQDCRQSHGAHGPAGRRRSLRPWGLDRG